MIKQYEADAVRWFILSDSPPEKDIQWSDTGVSSANKFTKNLNLNIQIISRKENQTNQEMINKFNSEIDHLVSKIDKTIEEFKFNVTIAHFYEIYKIFIRYIDLELNNEILKTNITKVMKLMIPFTPHLAYECLENLKCNSTDKWPDIKNNLLEKIDFAVQVNGKTRDVINVKKDLNEVQINRIIKDISKARKFIDRKL